MPPKSKKTKEPVDEIIQDDEQMPELDLVDKDEPPKREKYFQDVPEDVRAVLRKYTPITLLSYLREVGMDKDCPNHALANGIFRTVRDMHDGERPRQKNRQNQRSRSRSRGPTARNSDWGEPVHRESRSRSRERNPYQ